MDESLVLDWLKNVWSRVAGLKRRRAMLVLDAFKGHLTDSVKKQIASLHSDLVTIPGGMTSQLQVLDVVVNKPFKDHLKKAYTNWLLSEDHALTPTGKIKKPSVAILCKWIKCAWDEISKESIEYEFMKCCISNNMDGGEDDILWKNTESDNDTSEEESEDSEAEDLVE